MTPLSLLSVLVSTTASQRGVSVRGGLGMALVGVLGAAVLPGAWAQVAEQQTSEPTQLVSPVVDCKVTWSEVWTKCSPEGTQSRRYVVDVYPTRSGLQCPGPEVRPCSYPGPETIMIDGSDDGKWGTRDCALRRSAGARRMMQAYTGESHESFPMSSMCQYQPVKATVGDVLVFKKDAAGDDVFAVPSQWHYAQCNFSDGGAPLVYDSTSSALELRYTIRPGGRPPSFPPCLLPASSLPPPARPPRQSHLGVCRCTFMYVCVCMYTWARQARESSSVMYYVCMITTHTFTRTCVCSTI